MLTVFAMLTIKQASKQASRQAGRQAGRDTDKDGKLWTGKILPDT